MAQGKRDFEQMLKQGANRALPKLDGLLRRKVKYVTRRMLLEETGLSDNELQKLIHDGNCPRHSMRVAGQKAYAVEPTLRMLARYAGRWDYLAVD